MDLDLTVKQNAMIKVIAKRQLKTGRLVRTRVIADDLGISFAAAKRRLNKLTDLKKLKVTKVKRLASNNREYYTDVYFL